VTLCGRNSVQVTAPRSVTLDLAAFAARVPNANSNNPFSLRFEADGRTIILFRDGRAIVGGTSDPAVARSIYSRYVGD
jgi:adenylyltransferase/sulfurtransferase